MQECSAKGIEVPCVPKFGRWPLAPHPVLVSHVFVSLAQLRMRVEQGETYDDRSKIGAFLLREA